MDKFVVGGSNQITGSIAVAGAKNHALKLIPSCVLSKEPCVIHNIPDIEDVKLMLEIYKSIGGAIEKLNVGSYRFVSKGIHTSTIPSDLAAKLRASIMFIGPLLARFGEAHFPHPGGCLIGKRPIDIFLDGFKQLGAQIKFSSNYYHITAPNGLQGAKIVFRRISVTATENLIMTSTLAKGRTKLIFSAMEPEIPAIADFLNHRGAAINGAGTTTITVQGVKKLQGGETTCIPDRIETGTFAILGALSKKPLIIKKCDPSHLEVFWLHLKKMGVNFEIGNNWVKITPSKKQLISPSELIIHEYPGLMTDLQAPLVVLLTQAKGISLVHETIYEGRLLYTDILNKMGAHIIMCDPHRVIVQGPTGLHGGKITSPDIRAGIALLIGAIIAKGTSTIENVYQIKRGYENIVKRLQGIGVNISQLSE